MLIRYKRGLRLPLEGAPEQVVTESRPPNCVALLGADYQDLRCAPKVAVGDEVAQGQALFVDRRHPQVCYVSPAAGRVRAFNLGHQRRLESVIIELGGEVAIEHDRPSSRATPDAQALRAALLAAGLWPGFRTRPFDRTPAPHAMPRAIYVSALDTRPLCPDPAVIIGEDPDAFTLGLTLIARLAPLTYVCVAADTKLSIPDVGGLCRVDVAGPHPAGLPGSQIHRLSPDLSLEKEVWHVGYQDVLRIGRFWDTGHLDASQVVAVAGSGVKRPRLLRTRLGASLDDLLSGEVTGEVRILSGCPLSGREPRSQACYLGRYHNQVTCLSQSPIHPRGFRHDSGGIEPSSRHAVMLPLERFDRAWPLAVPPSSLLRSLLIRDVETARDLGCLALAEDDMAVCSYLCPGQLDYGRALRETLREIERLA